MINIMQAKLLLKISIRRNTVKKEKELRKILFLSKHFLIWFRLLSNHIRYFTNIIP